MTTHYIHTEPTNWTRLTSLQATLFDSNAALSVPGAYLHEDVLWTTKMDGSPDRVVLSGVPEGSSIAWKFYTDGADGNTGEARIWGISRIVNTDVTEYLTDYICKLKLTAGAIGVADTDPASSAILPVCKFVDTIDVVEDRAIMPGVRVISFEDDASAAVVLDGMGYWGYIIEIRPDTPDTPGWGALYRIFQAIKALEKQPACGRLDKANARKRLRKRKEKDMFGKRMIATVPAVVLALGGVQTAEAQAEIDALVFWDALSSNVTAQACRNLGYTLFETASEGPFIAQLQTQSYDFVGIELPWDLITQKETVAQLLEDHVAAGGRLLVNFNNLDEWPRLQTLLGLDDAIERLTPEDIPPLVPRHPSFAGFGLGVTGDPWPDSGDTLLPTTGSVVAAEFITGGAAIVVSSNTRVIVNGFDWSSYAGSAAFVESQIWYIMACRADFDRSTGLKVLDIFDFLAFQNAFVTQHPSANMKYDQVFDIFDFLAFQSAFVNGCQ